ncbi:hypothetical protein BsWGS_23409 [Bradybaena similaris]
MEATKGVLAVLAALCCSVECFLLFAKRQQPNGLNDAHPPDCDGKVEPCWEMWFESPISNQFSLEFRYLIDNIDDICSTYKKAADCMAPVYGCLVDDYLSFIDASSAARKYVCGDRARSLLRGAQHSSCYANETQLQFVDNLTTACYISTISALGSDKPALCGNSAIVVDCRVQALTHLCGNDYGKFLRELSNTTAEALHEWCTLETPEKYL